VAATQNLHLAFGLITISTEPMELSMLNFVYRSQTRLQILYGTLFIFMLTIINMETVWNFQGYISQI